MKNATQGFTFIEILITLAIFGIITSITAVAIAEVRSNANDKSIKSSLSTLQLRAELYFRENRNYTTVGGVAWDCSNGMWADSQIAQALTRADAAGPRTAGDGGIHCRTSSSQYAVWAQRPEGKSSNYWCVDSQQNECGVNLDLGATPSGASCGYCDVAE